MMSDLDLLAAELSARNAITSFEHNPTGHTAVSALFSRKVMALVAEVRRLLPGTITEGDG